jgi:alanine racemase
MTDAPRHPNQFRPTTAIVDLTAIEANVRALIKACNTRFYCAVVKANGYGHGAVEVAKAALRGGATHLAVALVEEGIELREGGVTEPIIVLSEAPVGAEEAIARHGLTATAYSERAIDLLSAAGGIAGLSIPVHLKIDTGMNRVGCQPSEAVALGKRMVAAPNLLHVGTFTHLAVADAVERPETNQQLAKFNACLQDLRSAGVAPGIVHASNSAGAIAHPDARYDMVRCGVAVYGQDPDSGLAAIAHGVELKPVLRWVSAVSHVKTLRAGERVSYGLMAGVDTDSVVVTVPVGYADGLFRRWSAVGGEVLIGGRRRPIIGRITMDQLVVDCGPVGEAASAPVARGDEVVLIGSQGDEAITIWDMATKLDTISYEITSALSERVPRKYLT